MTRLPAWTPGDEFEATLIDVIAEYRKNNMFAGVRGKRRTKTGYISEYLPVSEIHAALQARGIKKARSTVSRRIKEFLERERKNFEIAHWVDEMHNALSSVHELADRMNPEYHQETMDKIATSIRAIRLLIQPWAINEARNADDKETLARLVHFSATEFFPSDREKPVRVTVPNPPDSAVN